MLRLFKPRNPGAVTLDTSIFDKAVKQHTQRRLHLEYQLENLGKEIEAVHSLHEERVQRSTDERDKTLDHLEDRRSDLIAEHDEVKSREEALKKLTSNL